ncbi:MAG: DUF559 domain-containing protein [Pseudomonadota bacterium]
MRDGQNTARARALRRAGTLPERRAWSVLRKFRALGAPVRRQHPISKLTVDFAIVSARLVIEVDGPLHRRADVKRQDERRDAILRSAGWRVLRVTDEEAGDADGLFARVAREIGLDV